MILASAPYSSIDACINDMQMAAVKRLLPHIESIDSDRALAEDISGIINVFEDTVYAVARDVMQILQSFSAV